MSKKDKSAKSSMIAGVASGTAAALGKEMFSIDAAGGVTSKLMKNMATKLHTPPGFNYHVSNLLTKRLPAIGASTFAGSFTYDYLKNKTSENDSTFKRHVLPGLGAGAASAAVSLPIVLSTNAFPKELSHLKGTAALKTILKGRFGQALIAAPVGFTVYNKTKELLGEDHKVLPAVASGVAGTLATMPLMAKYERLKPSAEENAARLGKKLENASRFFQKPLKSGITRGRYFGRILSGIPSRMGAGIVGALISYPVFDTVKKYLEKNNK